MTGAASSPTVGRRFVEALVAKDRAALRALLVPDVDFVALTPGAHWTGRGPDSVVDETILGQWFEAGDVITRLVKVETGSVGERQHVGYRLAVTNPDGDWVVEQQCYFDVRDGRIAWLRILCSGFNRPDVLVP